MRQLTEKQTDAIEKAISILNKAGFDVELPYDLELTIVSHRQIYSVHPVLIEGPFEGSINFKI